MGLERHVLHSTLYGMHVARWRGGRYESWRIALTDESGRECPDRAELVSSGVMYGVKRRKGVEARFMSASLPQAELVTVPVRHQGTKASRHIVAPLPSRLCATP